MSDPKDSVIDAMLMHVPFDGWSETGLKAALADAGVSAEEGRVLFPAGAVDVALAFHRRADRQMADALASADLSSMRYSDRVAYAIRLRLELVETQKETVRRAATLFALPIHAPRAARAVWETCDAIWTALGDTSEDGNWYTKRATLSAVYSSVVLYWLGDMSEGHAATWSFLERRIDDVMRFEGFKRRVNENKLLAPLTAGPNWLMSQLRAPGRGPRGDLPGIWRPEDTGRPTPEGGND